MVHRAKKNTLAAKMSHTYKLKKIFDTIHFIKEQASNQNVKLIYLEVENHNQNAQKLYLAHDFEVHNRKILKHKL